MRLSADEQESEEDRQYVGSQSSPEKALVVVLFALSIS